MADISESRGRRSPEQARGGRIEALRLGGNSLSDVHP